MARENNKTAGYCLSRVLQSRCTNPTPRDQILICRLLYKRGGKNCKFLRGLCVCVHFLGVGGAELAA